MAGLACRACRQQLAADVKGCAICASIRRNLIAGDEGAEDLDRPALTTVSAEVLHLLRSRNSWYLGQLKKHPQSEVYAKGATANANALSKLLEAARRLQADGTSAVKAMGFVDKAKLFIGWFAELPPAYRNKLREQMDTHERDLLKAATDRGTLELKP